MLIEQKSGLNDSFLCGFGVAWRKFFNFRVGRKTLNGGWLGSLRRNELERVGPGSRVLGQDWSVVVGHGHQKNGTQVEESAGTEWSQKSNVLLLTGFQVVKQGGKLANWLRGHWNPWGNLACDGQKDWTACKTDWIEGETRQHQFFARRKSTEEEAQVHDDGGKVGNYGSQAFESSEWAQVGHERHHVEEANEGSAGQARNDEGHFQASQTWLERGKHFRLENRSSCQPHTWAIQ